MKVENLKVGDYYPDPRADIWGELKVEFHSLQEATEAGYQLWNGITSDWKIILNLKAYKEKYKKNPVAYMVYKWITKDKCHYVLALA